MTPLDITPALDAEEWKHRRCAPVAIDYVDGETHIVVTDPDGEIVSVSGPEEIFALLALANDALPNGDPRKMTRDRFQLLCMAADQYEASATRHLSERQRDTADAHQRLAGELREFARVVESLLPPPR